MNIGKVFFSKLARVTCDRKYCTYLGNLGWCNTNTIGFICVRLSKVTKTSTILVAISGIFAMNFDTATHNFIHAPSFSNSPFFAESIVKHKVVLNKVCKQSKRGWDTPKTYQHIEMSQLYQTKIA